MVVGKVKKYGPASTGSQFLELLVFHWAGEQVVWWVKGRFLTHSYVFYMLNQFNVACYVQ
jgi:hypothetical protein